MSFHAPHVCKSMTSSMRVHVLVSSVDRYRTETYCVIVHLCQCLLHSSIFPSNHQLSEENVYFNDNDNDKNLYSDIIRNAVALGGKNVSHDAVKIAKVSEVITFSGDEFQTVGAATEKARLAKTVRVRGTASIGACTVSPLVCKGV